MSFASPLVLVALLVLPALLALYLVDGRGRARAGAAFANPALSAAVTPRRPGFRRHIPFAIIALAIVALVVSAARPQRTVAVPVERASIMLATDTSGSMQATDVAPTRLVAVQRAAVAFSERVPKRVNIGVMQFGGRAAVLQSPTKDRDAVKAAVGRLTPRGGTAMGDAITTAVRALKRPAGIDGRRPPAALLLISDGASTRGVDPVTAAQQARRQKIPVYTVALGTANGTITVRHKDGSTETRRVPPDPGTLRQVARASGGRFFTAADAKGLDAIYEQLGSQLGRKQKKHEISSSFAGGALLLLLLGAVTSLRLFGRLI
ncbi:MAG: VWA domain-containing protein [Solirubrobacteraceae bacterium]